MNGKFIQRFVTALEEDASLQTLSMSSNGIQETKTMEGVRKVFKRNNTLTDLDLSNNRIGVEGGRELLFGLLENQSMRFLRLGGNPSLKMEEKELIERQLRGNRRRFYSPITNYRAGRSSVTESRASPMMRSPSVTVAASSMRGCGDDDESKMDHLPSMALASPPREGGTYAHFEGQPLRKICSYCSTREEEHEYANLQSPNQHLSACPFYIQTLEHHRSFSAPVQQHQQGMVPRVHRVSDSNGEIRSPFVGGGAAVVGGSGFTVARGGGEGKRGEDSLESSPRLRHHKSAEVPSLPSNGNGGRFNGGGRGSERKLQQDVMKRHDSGLSMDSDASFEGKRDYIEVLFSAPLAWRDLRGQLHPIEQIDIEQERELLIQSFQESGADITPRFGFATTESLRTAVTLGARALHYSGHGHKEGRLTFEDGEGGLQLVSVETLRSLCAAGEHQLQLVTVSSCFSKYAGQAFAEAGVPHVVCVHVEAQLADSAVSGGLYLHLLFFLPVIWVIECFPSFLPPPHQALAFTRSFYLSLAVGHTVANAFDIGRQAVAASPNVPNSASEVK